MAAKQAPLAGTKGKPRRRTQDADDLTHPLLGDSPTLQLIQPRDGSCRPPHAYFACYQDVGG